MASAAAPASGPSPSRPSASAYARPPIRRARPYGPPLVRRPVCISCDSAASGFTRAKGIYGGHRFGPDPIPSDCTNVFFRDNLTGIIYNEDRAGREPVKIAEHQRLFYHNNFLCPLHPQNLQPSPQPHNLQPTPQPRSRPITNGCRDNWKTIALVTSLALTVLGLFICASVISSIPYGAGLGMFVAGATGLSGLALKECIDLIDD